MNPDIQTLIDTKPTNTFLRSSNKNVELLYEICPKVEYKGNIKTPNSFDGRVTWKGCLTPVVNQGSCGSCWAIASVSSLSDRFNIQSMGMLNVTLSPTKLILCKSTNLSSSMKTQNVIKQNIIELKSNACFGNNLIDAFKTLYVSGTCTEKCLPYTLGQATNTTELPICQYLTGYSEDMCQGFEFNPSTKETNGIPQRMFRALLFYTVCGGKDTKHNSDYNIKINIYDWGPLSTAMKLHEDFYSLKKGQIYKWDKTSKFVSGHAVCIVGWGEDNNTKYWIVRGSWGENWCDNGFFKILRGKDECEIESNCICAIPDFFYNYKDAQTVIKVIKQRLNIKSLNSKLLRDLRRQIHKSVYAFAGGINHHNGYTRRAISTTPWLNTEPIIQYKSLPDWKIFIAGKHSSLYKRVNYQAKFKPHKSKNYYNILLVTIMLLLVVSILYIVYKIKIHQGNMRGEVPW